MTNNRVRFQFRKTTNDYRVTFAGNAGTFTHQFFGTVETEDLRDEWTHVESGKKFLTAGDIKLCVRLYGILEPSIEVPTEVEPIAEEPSEPEPIEVSTPTTQKKWHCSECSRDGFVKQAPAIAHIIRLHGAQGTLELS